MCKILRAYLLDEVEIDDTLGSLSRLSDKIWFKTALDQHNAGKCMDLSEFIASADNT